MARPTNPNWKPDLSAKPFVPSSAAYVVRLPCCVNPLKIRRRGVLGRCLQGLLVTVLLVTVIFNIVFIIDNSRRLKTPPNSIQYDESDDEIRNPNVSLDQKEEKGEGMISNL